MNEEMECMCLECGISQYIDLGIITLEDGGPEGRKLIRNHACISCGGPLALIGRAGDEPYYRLG